MHMMYLHGMKSTNISSTTSVDILAVVGYLDEKMHFHQITTTTTAGSCIILRQHSAFKKVVMGQSSNVGTAVVFAPPR